MDKKYSTPTTKKLSITIDTKLIIIVAIIILLISYAIPCYDGIREYNNGTCIKCGGHYRLMPTVAQKSDFFYYQCDDCGYTVRTTFFMH